MQPEVEKLFHELADLTPQQRAAYFAQHAVDAVTRREVERLLALDSGPDHLLEVEMAIGGAAAAAIESGIETEGRLCGQYRLLEQVGRGGMGAVYRAERIDGEVKQVVAVKLLHPSADGHRGQERFLQERQLLAGLHHPAIVGLLDAGHTEKGQPYLVMEFVDGEAIDRYCEGKELREQLTLFVRVCEAVAHAHRNLIIHRDLKPSNILVDRAGQPKLLDFGIAKLMEESPDPTLTVDRLLTPLYASPEQVTGARQTTATDVYSLGAVLYRAVTGRSPHESGEGGTALDILTGQKDLVPPRTVNPNLPRDVESILMRALAREPDERYSSVDAFSEDLQRYLDTKPVLARPDSLLYRASKFVRRNRVAVAVVTVLSVALAGTAAIAVRKGLDAQARFDQVRKMSRTFLFDFPDELDKVPGTTKTKELLVSTAREYLGNLAHSAGNDRGLLRELAEAYERLAKLQGGSISPNLGQRTEALESRRRAVEIRRRLAGEIAEDDAKLVNSMMQIADNLRNLGRLPEALSAAREAVDESARLLHGNEERVLLERSSTHQIAARVLQTLTRLEEAESELKAAEASLPAGASGKLLEQAIAVRQDRADVLQALGRVSEAISIMQQAERDGQKILDDGPDATARQASRRQHQVTWAQLAYLYDNPFAPSLENPEQALAYRKKLCNGWEELLALDRHNDDALSNLAVCESETAVTLLKVDPRAAVVMARQGLDKFEQLELRHPNAAAAYRRARGGTRMALALLAVGQPKEAIEPLQQSLRSHRALLGKSKDHPQYQVSLAWSLTVSARAEQLLGQTRNAQAALVAAIDLARPLAENPDLSYRRIAADALLGYSEIAGEPKRCESALEALKLWSGFKGVSSPWITTQRQNAERVAAGCSIR